MMLKPYNIRSKCVKCGDNRASTEYIILGANNQVMQRICSNCKYIWWEDPLDKVVKTELTNSP